MKAVGVVEATCEEIFELVMSMDGTRFEQVFPYTIVHIQSLPDDNYVVSVHPIKNIFFYATKVRKIHD